MSVTGPLLGFALPVSGSWATRENVEVIARQAEEAGYASLWTFQRLLHPAGANWDPVYHSVTDPLITLAYAAALTRRPRLGVAVVNLPFYSPVVLSKQLTTLDLVSDGRLDVGLGLGWAPEEFQAAGVDMARRGARAEEFLRALAATWEPEVSEFAGEFYRVPPSRIEPKPVARPHPPVLLGAASEPALRRAGRLADGWISSSRADLSRISQSIEIVRDAAREVGRDPDRLRFVVRGVVMVRPGGRSDRRPLSGSLEEIRSDLPVLAEAGVGELFVDLNFDPEIGSPSADARESMRRAQQVLTALAPG
ncbi:MAG: TIGR03619 family F420-dependent LLM class oxidoreductase [Mycobacteriales bacterium]